MKASVSAHYGSPDVIRVSEVRKPEPKADEVLIKVHATTVTRTDDGMLRPHPFFIRLSAGIFRVPDRGSVNPTALAGMGLRDYPCRMLTWKVTSAAAIRFGTASIT